MTVEAKEPVELALDRWEQDKAERAASGLSRKEWEREKARRSHKEYLKKARSESPAGRHRAAVEAHQAAAKAWAETDEVLSTLLAQSADLEERAAAATHSSTQQHLEKIARSMRYAIDERMAHLIDEYEREHPQPPDPQEVHQSQCVYMWARDLLEASSDWEYRRLLAAWAQRFPIVAAFQPILLERERDCAARWLRAHGQGVPKRPWWSPAGAPIEPELEP